MADTNPLDHFESQPESSVFSNHDDFEKLDAPITPGSGGGFDHQDEPVSEPSGGAYDPNQDREISTTTDANISGEEEAEEDLYDVHASEAEALAPHHVDDVMSPHAHEIENDDDVEEDEHDVEPDNSEFEPLQPSAPVPEKHEPLISFDSPEDDHPPSQSDSPVSLSNIIPEHPIEPIHNNLPVQIQPSAPESDEHKAIESEKETEVESVRESEQPIVKEQTSDSVEKTKGSWLKGVDPRVIDLIYWRDVKKTGIVFGTMMVVLLSLAIFSLMSVVAYLSLAALTVTFSFTIYKKVMGAVQKSSEGHPFKPLLEMDISLREDKLKSVIQSVLKNVNCTLSELRRLFLIEDIVDSIKFGLLLWVLTYIGAWFNGMTLVILAVVLLFSLPKVYETYQVQIDNYIGMAKAQVDNVLNIVHSKLPFLKKKDKTQ